MFLHTGHRRMWKFRPKQLSWTPEEDEGDFTDHAQKNGQKTCQVFIRGDSESLNHSHTLLHQLTEHSDKVFDRSHTHINASVLQRCFILKNLCASDQKVPQRATNSRPRTSLTANLLCLSLSSPLKPHPQTVTRLLAIFRWLFAVICIEKCLPAVSVFFSNSDWKIRCFD